MNNISDRNYQYEMNNISDRNYQYDMMPNYMKNIPNSINYIPNMDNAKIKMMEKNTQILEPYQGRVYDPACRVWWDVCSKFKIYTKTPRKYR